MSARDYAEEMGVKSSVADTEAQTGLNNKYVPEASDDAGEIVNYLKPQNLLDELAQSGAKYTPDDVITVAKTYDGKLMWLEKGNSSSGLQHITERHATEACFNWCE